MVQVFINGIYRSMKWMKATPLPEVQALVAPKHFSGYDSDAVTAELGFDTSTWTYDGTIDRASLERGAKPWYRKGTEIPVTKYEDIVDISFPRRGFAFSEMGTPGKTAKARHFRAFLAAAFWAPRTPNWLAGHSLIANFCKK